jgi:hypothetical protein
MHSPIRTTHMSFRVIFISLSTASFLISLCVLICLVLAISAGNTDDYRITEAISTARWMNLYSRVRPAQFGRLGHSLRTKPNLVHIRRMMSVPSSYTDQENRERAWSERRRYEDLNEDRQPLRDVMRSEGLVGNVTAHLNKLGKNRSANSISHNIQKKPVP